MVVKREELLPLLDNFSQSEILVVGDLILDHYVWGGVDRISPEAPVVVVQVTEESSRLGGAANVAHNLVALGAQVKLSGVVGDDAASGELLTLLGALGIDGEGVVKDPSRPTTVKTRVVAHSQQVVRFDRENIAQIQSPIRDKVNSYITGVIPRTQGVIVSDYGKGCVNRELFDSVFALKEKGELGLASRALLVDPKSPHYEVYRGATVIKPNRREAEEASGIRISSREDARKAGNILLEKWNCEVVLITLGGDGMVLVRRSSDNGDYLEVDTVARKVFDVSGAGDTVSAVFSLALSVGSTLEQAVTLANIAAGIVVGEVGTVAVTETQLRLAIEDL